jgi:hypothetical protein
VITGFYRQALVVLGIGLTLAGCESLVLTDGPPPPRDQLAQIVGDTRLGGSLPLVIAIRRIDGRELGLRYSGAYVAPGEHDLLIDCTVTESKHTSRHHLRVDVDAGVKYRLVADTGRGNRSCVEVQLVSR